MNITIKEKIAKDNNLTVEEVILLLFIERKKRYEDVEKSLIDKGMITYATTDKKAEYIGPFISRKAMDTVNNIIINSDDKKLPEEDIEELAKQLKEVFPKGKKPGSGNHYWAGGVQMIKKRLKLFFKKYGDDFSHEDIVQAANNYVSSFNGDYRFMRTLKYFIFKEPVNALGEVESTSDLIDYLDNLHSDEELIKKVDWTSTLN